MTSLAVQQEGRLGLFLSLHSGRGLPLVRVLVFVLAPGSWESISALSHLFPSCAVGLALLWDEGRLQGRETTKLRGGGRTQMVQEK